MVDYLTVDCMCRRTQASLFVAPSPWASPPRKSGVSPTDVTPPANVTPSHSLMCHPTTTTSNLVASVWPCAENWTHIAAWHHLCAVARLPSCSPLDPRLVERCKRCGGALIDHLAHRIPPVRADTEARRVRKNHGEAGSSTFVQLLSRQFSQGSNVTHFRCPAEANPGKGFDFAIETLTSFCVYLIRMFLELFLVQAQQDIDILPLPCHPPHCQSRQRKCPKSPLEICVTDVSPPHLHVNVTPLMCHPPPHLDRCPPTDVPPLTCHPPWMRHPLPHCLQHGGSEWRGLTGQTHLSHACRKKHSWYCVLKWSKIAHPLKHFWSKGCQGNRQQGKYFSKSTPIVMIIQAQ